MFLKYQHGYESFQRIKYNTSALETSPHYSRPFPRLMEKAYVIKQAEKFKLARVSKETDPFMEKHCLSKLKGTRNIMQIASMY
jgi:hypothetical protein